MTTKKGSAAKKSATKKKAAPLDAPTATPDTAARAEKNDRDPTMQAIVDQGAHARRNAIAREDAPHPGGDALKAWQQGWDEQDGKIGK